MTAIDLGLVEEGIEIGKKIMAEVIAAYPNAGKGAAAAALGAEALAKAAPTPISHEASDARTIAEAQSKAQVVPAVGNGSGYLNEVSSLNVPHKPEH